MQTRSLGPTGPSVSAIGLGCMGMSGTYGPADDAESVQTIGAALDAGVTLLDTGDFYGQGHNELLLREALWNGRRDRVFLCVKFGALRDPRGQYLRIDARPDAIKNFVGYSLRRLGTEYIDLYQPSRLDPAVPIEETVGALAELVQAGYIRHIGLSEVSSETIRRAHAVHPITAVQLEYSIVSRGIEQDILCTLRELGIGLVAYGVLSRGLLRSDASSSDECGARDIRRNMPRFQGENFARNQQLIAQLRPIADAYGITIAQLAMAWALSRGTDIVPLMGARTREQLASLLEAAEVTLSACDLERIDAAIPADAVAGTRYPTAGMAHLDSERAAPVPA